MYTWLQLSDLVLFGSVAHVHPVWDNQASHTVPGVLLQRFIMLHQDAAPRDREIRQGTYTAVSC
jgi:hypothetical protein